eukprot:3061-Eustigmatos_ZCMA.PRE.1
MIDAVEPVVISGSGGEGVRRGQRIGWREALPALEEGPQLGVPPDHCAPEAAHEGHRERGAFAACHG